MLLLLFLSLFSKAYSSWPASSRFSNPSKCNSWGRCFYSKQPASCSTWRWRTAGKSLNIPIKEVGVLVVFNSLNLIFLKLFLSHPFPKKIRVPCLMEVLLSPPPPPAPLLFSQQACEVRKREIMNGSGLPSKIHGFELWSAIPSLNSLGTTLAIYSLYHFRCFL